MKSIFVFIVLLLTVGVTVARQFLDIINVSSGILVATLIAIVVTYLTKNHRMALVVLILGLTGMVNMSEEFLSSYYLDRDVLLATLIVIIFTPASRVFAK